MAPSARCSTLNALPAGAAPASTSGSFAHVPRADGRRLVASTARRSRPRAVRRPPSPARAHHHSHAGSAASADAARAAAQEAGKALSANSAQASKAIADARREVLKNEQPSGPRRRL